jgi:hypothetical protein
MTATPLRAWIYSGRAVQRLRYAVVRLLALPLRVVFERATLAAAHWHTAAGCRVGVIRGSDAEAVGARIDAALEVITQLDPRRAVWLRSARVRIVASHIRLAQYWYTTDAIVLDQAFALTASDAYLALAIVHEATHARIARAGIWPWPDLVPRLEVRCHREEIAFAQCLPRAAYPGTDTAIAQYEERIRIYRARLAEHRERAA